MEKKAGLLVPKYFRPDRRRLRYFLRLFLCAASLYGSILLLYTMEQTKKGYSTMQNSEFMHLKLGESMFTHELEDIMNDALLFQNFPGLQALLIHPTANRQEHINRVFSVFSSMKKHYDQIRYVDNSGMEVIRVDRRNGRAVLVDGEQLQDKSERYYFKKSMGLAKGQIYLSPIDLNVEHGTIEFPPKPMLRIVSAAVDPNNRKHGVFIFNYLVEHSFDTFKQAFLHKKEKISVHTHGRPLILNRDGYYLLAENPEDEWGFMFDRKQVFPRQYPEVWSLMQEKDAAQVRTPSGFFSFVKVYPLKRVQPAVSSDPPAAGSADQGGKDRDYYWILVSRIPNDELESLISILPQFPWLLFLVTLLAGCPLLWLFVTIQINNQDNQEDVRAGEKMLQEAQEIAHIGHWKYAVSSNNHVWSDEMYRILGLEPGRVTPSWSLFMKSVHPDDRKTVRKIYQEALKYRKNGHLVYRLLLADNTVKHVDGKWTVTFDTKDKPLLFFGTVQDITGQKRMQGILIQSEKMTTVAGLAAGVAHEINTPLSAILQSTQIIEQGLAEDRPKNRELAEECGLDLARVQEYWKRRELDYFLAGIRDSALSASDIIGNLLRFSRPVKSSMAPVNIGELLDSTVQLAHADYDLRKKYDIVNLVIRKEYDPDLPVVTCVAMEISQVLLNLIKNAVQAMGERAYEEGNREIRPPKMKQQKPLLILRTRRVDDRIRIEVEDNGPGMSNEVRSQIFDPFFTTKDVGEGTGLGLFVSYSSIVDKHRGRLWVESEPGRGAKFVVELAITLDELKT